MKDRPHRGRKAATPRVGRGSIFSAASIICCGTRIRFRTTSDGVRLDYAVSGDGRCGFASGLPDAADIAVRECRTSAKEACSLYAVGGEVVWMPDGKGTAYAGGAAGK